MNNSIFQLSITLLLTLIITACTSGGDGDGSGVPAVPGTHQVLAFNDLGMHCADLDYSTFVILPPFNVVHSQVIERGATPRILDDTQVRVSYRAVTDSTGSINSTSQNQGGAVIKSNFWDTNPDTGKTYVSELFGIDPPADEGLALDANLGQKMPGILAPYSANDAQLFNRFDTDKAWFAADGVPILPLDDFGQQNAYPLMRVSASIAATGETVANLDVVLPVASEADCQNCHALGEVATRDNNPDYIFPKNINDPNDVLQAAKHNILVLHDAEHRTDLLNEKPVLCARCHYSAALD